MSGRGGQSWGDAGGGAGAGTAGSRWLTAISSPECQAENSARKVKVKVKAPASALKCCYFSASEVGFSRGSLGFHLCTLWLFPRCSIDVFKGNLEVHLMENRIRPGEGGGGFAW